MDEFSQSPNILENVGSDPAVAVLEENSERLLGYIVVRSSPLSRSTNPLLHAGYILLDPDSGRKRGLAGVLFSYIEYIGKSLGYSGMLGRTSIVSPSIYGLMKNGTR